VTTVNTGFLTILQKSRESVFISENDNLRRTLLRAHAVTFAFLLVNGKKAHIHFLCGILCLELKFADHNYGWYRRFAVLLFMEETFPRVSFKLPAAICGR
jgi:hypothetical protein